MARKPKVKNEFYMPEQDWRGQTVEVEADTKLQDDKGIGVPVIIRTFEFAANPDVFKVHTPTSQELFDSHRRGISAQLWTDGLTPIEAQSPRIVFSKDKRTYMIFVTCTPSLGNTLIETPQTLSEIANAPNNTKQLSRSV